MVLLGFILRHPLDKMLNARPIRRLEAGPAGIKVEYFDKVLEETRNELADAQHQRQKSEALTSVESAEIGAVAEDGDYMAEMKRLAQISPSAAVLESFARLDRELRDAVEPTQVKGQPTRKISSVRPLARRAVDGGILAPSELAAFDDVTAIRNAVSHQRVEDLDVDRALAYAELVQQLIISIRLSTGRTVADGPAT